MRSETSPPRSPTTSRNSNEDLLSLEERQASSLLAFSDRDRSSSQSRQSSIFMENEKPSTKSWTSYFSSACSSLSPTEISWAASEKCLSQFGGFMTQALIPTSAIAAYATPRNKLHPTAYLDGLRGVAALFVSFHHYTNSFYPRVVPGHFLGDIRALEFGRFMVAIFFVISGYVLSYKTLRLARERDSEAMFNTLTSSVFRRWMRLMLPVFLTMTFTLIISRMGLIVPMPDSWMDYINEQIEAVDGNIPNAVRIPDIAASFEDQAWQLLVDFKTLADPLRFGGLYDTQFGIGGVTWTLPLELMGSLIVFVVLMGVCRATSVLRLGVLFGIMAFAQYNHHWIEATFLGGLFLAELSFSHKPLKSKHHLVQEVAAPRRSLFVNICCALLFLFSLGLSSTPFTILKTLPLYKTFIYYIASGNTSLEDCSAIGGILVVLAIELAPFLQRPFTSRFAQFLGRISFSLYLLHYTLIYVFAVRWVPFVFSVFGRDTVLGGTLGLLLAFVPCWMFTFYVADIYTRWVDAKSVKFAGWLMEMSFSST